MDILEGLNVSITETCVAQFAKASRDLKSKLTAHEAALAKAKDNAVIAEQARQSAECKLHELQNEVMALREELSFYDSNPADLEVPTKSVDLERDFAPENIWGTKKRDVDQSQESLEQKYRMIYNNLQIYNQSWSSLKAQVMKHKKKLSYVTRLLERDEFTFTLTNGPVTFQRVSKMDKDNFSKPTNLLQSPRTSTPHASRLEDTTGGMRTTHSRLDSPRGADRTDAVIKKEQDSRNTGFLSQSDPCRTQSSPDCGLEALDSTLETLPPLPNLQARKRKRDKPQNTDDIPDRPVLVKTEVPSSSPMQCSVPGLGQPFPSTQDLDEIGDSVQTPTKRRASGEARWKNPDPEKHPALQSIDGNARATKSSARNPENSKRKTISSRALLSMTEDGESGEDASHSKSSNSSNPGSTAKKIPFVRTPGYPQNTGNRLQGLLESPVPSKPQLKAPKHTRPQTSPRQREVVAPTETRPAESVSFQESPPQQSASQLAPDVQPEDEPYRSLPLHRLNLSHFKINPKRNDGFDFAYDDVIRNKNERKCLTGCMRPDCCGDRFRAMARLGAVPGKPDADQRQEDERVLKEYLGDDLSSLSGLNEDERETTLVEARARAIANQYGRHRHHHQRARTPPGFWRSEMPSTQELESDREAAQKLEREKVEERYREAMRPEGRWIWADE